jgi:type IV pilus assembly protein PilW
MINARTKYATQKTIAKGLSLIELMVSLLIGLLVVGSAIAIFISNRQTYTATENVGRIQENMRTAFELVSRDVREAGASACAKGLPVANVLNNPATNWWSSWNGVTGYGGAQAMPGLAFGTAVGARVASTDAIQLMSSSNSGYKIEDTPGTPSADFKLNTAAHDIIDGDIVMACDYLQASIFQVTQSNPGTNANIVFNTGGSTVPGNCSKGLGLPTICTAVGTDYKFSPNSTLAKLRAVRWYIGNNPNGGRSLYQSSLNNASGTVTSVPQEIAEGVQNMTLTYLVNGVYLPAASVTADNWRLNVSAVRISLVFQGNDAIGTDGNRIQRQITSTVTLRNRNI